MFTTEVKRQRAVATIKKLPADAFTNENIPRDLMEDSNLTRIMGMAILVSKDKRTGERFKPQLVALQPHFDRILDARNKDYSDMDAEAIRADLLTTLESMNLIDATIEMVHNTFEQEQNRVKTLDEVKTRSLEVGARLKRKLIVLKMLDALEGNKRETAFNAMLPDLELMIEFEQQLNEGITDMDLGPVIKAMDDLEAAVAAIESTLLREGAS